MSNHIAHAPIRTNDVLPVPSHPTGTKSALVAHLSVLLAVLLWAWAAPAQQGTWAAGFDHATTGPAAQNVFTQPFQGTDYEAPAAPYEWGAPMYGGRFHAVHMAVIPKGPHQGKVLVWDVLPVILRPNRTLEPQGRFWACQAWSVVDPDTQQFWNYLLPLQPVVGSGPFDENTIEVADLFCTGHAWSQHGDLVVAGGTTADFDGTTTPPTPVGVRSAKFLFLFDPSAASQPFPGQPPVTSLYPSPHVGRWLQYLGATGGLLVDRFYPTVTLSQKITTRNGLDDEIVIISGGSDPLNPSPPGDPRNNYECYVVRASGSPLGFLTPDPDPTPQTVLPGPSTPGVTQGLEWFAEYPRWHLLSTGTVFLSGPVPLSSQVDLRTSTPRTWDIATGRSGGALLHRHDGASLFFARLNAGAQQDVVVRLGGNEGDIATDTAEFVWRASTAHRGRRCQIPAEPERRFRGDRAPTSTRSCSPMRPSW